MILACRDRRVSLRLASARWSRRLGTRRHANRSHARSLRLGPGGRSDQTARPARRSATRLCSPATGIKVPSSPTPWAATVRSSVTTPTIRAGSPSGAGPKNGSAATGSWWWSVRSKRGRGTSALVRVRRTGLGLLGRTERQAGEAHPALSLPCSSAWHFRSPSIEPSDWPEARRKATTLRALLTLKARRTPGFERLERADSRTHRVTSASLGKVVHPLVEWQDVRDHSGAWHSRRAGHVGYRSLAECVRDLETTEAARRHRSGGRPVPGGRRHPAAGLSGGRTGPACSAGPRGRRSRSLGNLFGTLDRAKFLFRDALESVRRLVELKVDPGALARNPWRYRGVPRTLWRLLPRRVRSGPILAHRITIDQLPQIQCWPMDGGPFVTLPQVYTEDPDRPGPGAVKPGDVPGPARRQPVRAEPRGRAALPDPPRASACTTRRRSVAVSRCGSTSSSAARPP